MARDAPGPWRNVSEVCVLFAPSRALDGGAVGFFHLFFSSFLKRGAAQSRGEGKKEKREKLTAGGKDAQMKPTTKDDNIERERVLRTYKARNARVKQRRKSASIHRCVRVVVFITTPAKWARRLTASCVFK